jgi:polysaccharide biosynthesis/export protein
MNTLMRPFFSTAIILMLGVGLAAEPSAAQTQAVDVPADVQVTTPLKPGDQIRLGVAGFPELSGEQIILSDGTIQIPMAGSLKLARLTPIQATAVVTEALRPYVRRPQVALSVVALSPLRISVTGEVLQPGPRLLNPFVQQNRLGTGNQTGNSSPVTASDALMLAGGVTPTADLRNIIVHRMVPIGNPSARAAGTIAVSTPLVPASTPMPPSYSAMLPPPAINPAIAAPQMVKTEIKIDLWKAVETGDLTADARIYDGDEIVVPLTKLNGTDQQTLLMSTLAPNRIMVQVTGEVNRPGQIEVAPTARVIESIATAGGLTDKANKKSIELFRMSSDGKLERQTFAFDQPSVPLRNGDLIVVKKNGSSSFFDTLGRLLIPFYPVTTIINLLK